MKATVTGLSAYKRHGLPELRADVKLETGDIVPVYHSPRETNVEVTRDWTASVDLTPERAGRSDLNGPEVHIVAETSEEYGVRYRLASYQADQSVLDDVFASIA